MPSSQSPRLITLSTRNVNSMGDELIATSSVTGDKLGSMKLSGDMTRAWGALGTAPLAAGDSVVFATLAGEIRRLDPTSGKVGGTWKIDCRIRAQPVVHDGWIYVGTEDGRLIAIDTGDRTLTGWSMWGGNAQRSGIGPAVAKR